MDELQEWGLRLEQPILDKFAELHGCQLKPASDLEICFHDTLPFHCTCDSQILAPCRIGEHEVAEGTPVEVKTAHHRAGREWAEKVPKQYLAQSQVQLFVLEKPTLYIACLIDGYHYRWYRVERHEGWIKQRLLGTALAFWRDFVETRTPPPVDSAEETRLAMQRHYKDDGSVVMAGDDWEGFGQKYDSLAEEIKQKTAEFELLRNQIRSKIGDCTTLALPDEAGGFRWRSGKRGRPLTRAKSIKIESNSDAVE